MLNVSHTYWHLYQQAQGWSRRLEPFVRSSAVWKPGLRLLDDSGQPRVYDSAAQLNASIEILRAASADLARTIPRIGALPALHQMLADNYYSFSDSAGGDHPLPLPVIKIAAAQVFAHGPWTQAEARGARDRLQLLLAYSWLEYQLIAMRQIRAIRRGVAVLTDTGLEPDDELEEVATGQRHAFSVGGRIQRFANGTTERMFVRPHEFLAAAFGVLAGDPPSDVAVFSGTHLAQFPDAVDGHAFWVGLTARLQLLVLARDRADQAGSSHLAIFEEAAVAFDPDEPALRGVTRSDFHALQQAVMRCFWRPGTSVAADEESTMFVDRPVMRIAREPGLFVTSTLNIADSLTSVAERAVSPRVSDVSLPPKYFEQLLSGPFEERIIAMFRDHGFLAGEVTRSGAWKTQAGIRTSRVAGKPDGQIDVLAWHPGGMLIVGDCKVLALAHTPEAATTQWAKLGEDDEEQFRAKLHKREKWSQAFLADLGHDVSTTMKMLILDRPLHLWLDGGDIDLVYEGDLMAALAEAEGIAAAT